MNLIEDIGIYKSCSYLELLFLFLIAFVTTTTLMLLLPFIPVGIGMVASAMIALALLSLLATFYREKKRNLPERFCNTPQKPNNSKVENSIIKNKEFSHEKIKIYRHTNSQHT